VMSFVAVSTAPPASASGACLPRSRDSDHDALPDCWERRNGLRVGVRDQRTDKDRDLLRAVQEYSIDRRTFGDGSIFRPYQADERNSGGRGNILDGYKDIDGDGFFNAAEFAWGTDPLRASSFPVLPPSGCVPVPTRIPADGSRSVTLELRAVIDVLPDGSCLELSVGGNYRSNGELVIFQKHDFTLDGNGARLFTDVTGPINTDGSDHSERQQLVITSGSNITVEDLVIDGPNTGNRFILEYEIEAGVRISGVQGATLRDLRIRQVHGDFFQIGDWGGGSGNPQPSRDVLVTGGDFDRAGRAGVDLSNSSEGVVIDGNSFNRMRLSGVGLEILPGKHVSDVTVSNNTFSNINLFWVGSRSRGPATNIAFIGNHLVGKTMQVKVGTNEQSGVRHANWTFDSNVSDTPVRGSEKIFYLRNLDGIRVTGNTQPFIDGAQGIIFEIDDVCAINLGFNEFENWQGLYWPAPPVC
jgi:Right handed beta helix region